MNWDSIQQILRVALQILGGILIKDNVEAGQHWEAASAGIINIAAFGWMFFANRKSAQVTKVAAIDGVTVQVSKSEAPSLAAATAGESGVKSTA